MHTNTLTIEQITSFLKGTESLDIETGSTIAQRYRWMEETLIGQRYLLLRKKEKSVIRQFLRRCSGYSQSHVDHCITRYRKTGRIRRTRRAENAGAYETHYTTKDIALLARTSEAFFHQNGKALKEVCADMYTVYGDDRFERLSHISVSHIYNLRKTVVYQNEVVTYTKTKPSTISIGERKKPHPEGKPGYIRVDSVHQGDRDKEKGVYHIHLVDEVTQMDVQLASEGLSEHFLIPVLEEALVLFPFTVVNFHSDNGSEYINETTAGLLNRLTISQTKSRSLRTNDNALIGGKHAATVRPVYGKTYIPKRYAEIINGFNKEHLIPFLNRHRKCAFPTEEVDAKTGKMVKKYRDFMTPYEKLLSLPDVAEYLKPGVSIDCLRQEMRALSHLAAAEAMQKARTKLFNSFKN